MSFTLKWFLIFLLINAIITLIYMIIAIFFRKTNRHLALLRGIVMLLAPGAGPLFIFLGWFGYEFIFRKDVDLSDVVFSKDRGRELVRTNEDVERNVVSIEEAITVSDNRDLRALVMGVAQGDYSESLASISLALDCDDSETAHYAASVLQDALNGFRLRVSKEYNQVIRRGDNVAKEAIELIEYMDKVLVQKVFAMVEQKSFANKMADVAQILFEEKLEAVTEEVYEAVCLRLLEVGEFERCEEWCNRSMSHYPEALASYTCKLKLYFNSNRQEEFFDTLTKLKAAPVIIDSQTLELIRAFS